MPIVINFSTTAEDGHINYGSGGPAAFGELTSFGGPGSVNKTGTLVSVATASYESETHQNGYLFIPFDAPLPGKMITSAILYYYIRSRVFNFFVSLNVYGKNSVIGTTLTIEDFNVIKNSNPVPVSVNTTYLLGWNSCNVPISLLGMGGALNPMCFELELNPQNQGAANVIIDAYENVSGNKAYLAVTYDDIPDVTANRGSGMLEMLGVG